MTTIAHSAAALTESSERGTRFVHIMFTIGLFVAGVAVAATGLVAGSVALDVVGVVAMLVAGMLSVIEAGDGEALLHAFGER